MSNPSTQDRAILACLSETGGFLTARVATLMRERGIGLGTHSPRIQSAHIRQDLLRLKRAGLVTEMDGDKPVCWIRTKAGTAALEQGTPS